MSLEIKLPRRIKFTRVCGRCLAVVNSTNIGQGTPVMVGPLTSLNRDTHWGDNAHFGRVKVTSRVASANEDSNGQTHLLVHIGIIDRSVDGGIDIDPSITSAHNLKTLP